MSVEPLVHVVDDDGAVRDSIAFLFAANDIPAATHESASAFLDAVHGPLAGCIVTDVRMPGLSGVELIRAAAE